MEKNNLDLVAEFQEDFLKKYNHVAKKVGSPVISV